MQWIYLVLFYAVISTVCCEPEPKKYAPDVKTKGKDASLTDDEKKFLREVEAKFGIKSEAVENNKEDSLKEKDKKDSKDKVKVKINTPFPAVIAIEIVNDTDINIKSKGKRTIDANLGYGYQTNSGYTYTYLGKPREEKGKFMIYPYSQEDIPPAYSNNGYSKTTKISPNVEITPSQAYELVPSKEEDNSYYYEKPKQAFDSPYSYVKSVQSPPPPPSGGSQSHPSTLYTTYNGEQFSDLSGQFPSVQSNYLVDSSQLLNNPQYQSAGVTQEHLKAQGTPLEQRVVPVLVLRVPSSYIKNPSAELYANLPENYPLSHYLNHLNLQQLVNQYFKRIGFKYAPQVMTYPNTVLESAAGSQVLSPATNIEPQQYYGSYAQHSPSYTETDYSGVQYSSVQPVVAKYPIGYQRQQYYIKQPQYLYQKPQQQQQYQYRYQYNPASISYPHYSHSQPQYQQEVYKSSAEHETSEHETPNADYRLAEIPKPEIDDQSATYNQYEAPKEDQSNTSSYKGQPEATPVYMYGNSQSVQVQYEEPEQKDTVAVYPRSQTGHTYSPYLGSDVAQAYQSEQAQPSDDSENHGLTLTENYPSKDHTIATVLPLGYKTRKPSSGTIQTVNYVTPKPHTKYHSQYKVMVPQTVLASPASDKVTYVNSQSNSNAYSHRAVSSGYHPQEQYAALTRYSSQLSKQRPPYPKNHHAHPKRMARSEIKIDAMPSKKPIESSEKKESS